MIIQFSNFQENQFILYFIVLFVGFELVIYIFFQYHKVRKTKIQLNKILIAFGAFFLFLVVNVFITVINNFLISDLVAQYILYKVSLELIIISPVLFIFFVTIEEFSSIINLKIAKGSIISSLIPIVLIMLLPGTISLIFILAFTFASLFFVIVIVFQIKLIKISISNMRKRLILVFIGEVLAFYSLIIERGINLILPSSIVSNTMFVFGVMIFISGFMISFLALYRFPTFYELKWQDNLLKLFIINQQNYNCLYNCDFVKTLEQGEKATEVNNEYRKDEFLKLFSGGIAGIDVIISDLTNSGEEKINKIKHGDSFIFLEYGTPQIIYALIVQKDSNTNNIFLSSIKSQFESFYKEILSSLEDLKVNQAQLFGSFDIILRNLLKT